MSQCQRCRATPPEGARFCPQCGSVLTTEPAAQREPEPAAHGLPPEFTCATCGGHFATVTFPRYECPNCRKSLCPECRRKNALCPQCRGGGGAAAFAAVVIAGLLVATVYFLGGGC